MERASKLLRQYRYAGKCLTPADLVRAVWPRAVGKYIAAHSRVESLWNGRLTVAVDDPIWLDNLNSLAGQIAPLVDKAAGSGLVKSIEFRVDIPRRGPVRAEAAADPDGIADPILGHLYRAAKKRAGA